MPYTAKELRERDKKYRQLYYTTHKQKCITRSLKYYYNHRDEINDYHRKESEANRKKNNPYYIKLNGKYITCVKRDKNSYIHHITTPIKKYARKYSIKSIDRLIKYYTPYGIKVTFEMAEK